MATSKLDMGMGGGSMSGGRWDVANPISAT
jgi:hypothetical protein